MSKRKCKHEKIYYDIDGNYCAACYASEATMKFDALEERVKLLENALLKEQEK